jgi:hypothetical protein
LKYNSLIFGFDEGEAIKIPVAAMAAQAFTMCIKEYEKLSDSNLYDWEKPHLKYFNISPTNTVTPANYFEFSGMEKFMTEIEDGK